MIIDAHLHQTELKLDKEIERANDEARTRKLALKRSVIQPALEGNVATVTVVAPPADAAPEKERTRRQREKRATQREEARRHRENEEMQKKKNESRKLLREVEPLRQAAGTVVVQELETLDSVKAHAAQLVQEEKKAKAAAKAEKTADAKVEAKEVLEIIFR